MCVNPDTAYDRTRLARRQKLPLAPGVDAYFARPEDVILYKLLYAREGGELHLRDVLGIIRVSGPDLTSDTSPSGLTDSDWRPSGSRRAEALFLRAPAVKFARPGFAWPHFSA